MRLHSSCLRLSFLLLLKIVNVLLMHADSRLVDLGDGFLPLRGDPTALMAEWLMVKKLRVSPLGLCVFRVLTVSRAIIVN